MTIRRDFPSLNLADVPPRSFSRYMGMGKRQPYVDREDKLTRQIVVSGQNQWQFYKEQ